MKILPFLLKNFEISETIFRNFEVFKLDRYRKR